MPSTSSVQTLPTVQVPLREGEAFLEELFSVAGLRQAVWLLPYGTLETKSAGAR